METRRQRGRKRKKKKTDYQRKKKTKKNTTSINPSNSVSTILTNGGKLGIILGYFLTWDYSYHTTQTMDYSRQIFLKKNKFSVPPRPPRPYPTYHPPPRLGLPMPQRSPILYHQKPLPLETPRASDHFSGSKPPSRLPPSAQIPYIRPIFSLSSLP